MKLPQSEGVMRMVRQWAARTKEIEVTAEIQTSFRGRGLLVPFRHRQIGGAVETLSLSEREVEEIVDDLELSLAEFTPVLLDSFHLPGVMEVELINHMPREWLISKFRAIALGRHPWCAQLQESQTPESVRVIIWVFGMWMCRPQSDQPQEGDALGDKPIPFPEARIQLMSHTPGYSDFILLASESWPNDPASP